MKIKVVHEQRKYTNIQNIQNIQNKEESLSTVKLNKLIVIK